MNETRQSEYKLWDFSDHRLQSLIFKVTEQCNLACDYCYRIGVKRAPCRMNLNTIRNAVAGFAGWIDANKCPERPICLVWHGGEPLICGIDYYRNIFKMEEEFKERGYLIQNAFQTNGTLISQEWIDLFKRHDVAVGISIDGPKYLHDVHRKRMNRTSSFEETMKGVRLLAQNRYPYSAISVVSNETVGRINESLDFFVDEGFEIVDFIPSFLHGDPCTLNTESYERSMIHLYDHWKEKYASDIYIRFLGDIEGKILDNVATIGCELAGYCGENFSIDVSGNVYPCECVSTFGELCIGNINREDFKAMIANRHFSKWKALVNVIDDHCLDSCKLFEICRGGCFNRRYCGNGEAGGRDPFCVPRYRIIKHIRQRLQEVQ